METNYLNQIQLKMLLIDAITVIKFKNHIAPNYKAFKNTYCKMFGLPTGCTAKKLINALHYTYKDNNLESEFLTTIEKFKVKEHLTREFIS